ncbi:MAG: hypothetical protein R2939_18685 [Kofleriaceae bacterium]
MELLAVGRVHARQERGERGPPDLALALVEVVGDVVVEQRQHRRPVLAAEGVVVGTDDGGGVGHAGTVARRAGPGLRAPHGVAW